jgi:hypothetical protein
MLQIFSIKPSVGSANEIFDVARFAVNLRGVSPGLVPWGDLDVDAGQSSLPLAGGQPVTGTLTNVDMQDLTRHEAWLSRGRQLRPQYRTSRPGIGLPAMKSNTLSKTKTVDRQRDERNLPRPLLSRTWRVDPGKLQGCEQDQTKQGK